MDQKWNSKKLTAFIIFACIVTGLLITEFCTPNQDVFGEKSTLWLVIGLSVGFLSYIFGQSLVDAAKEVAAQWLSKKLG